MENCKVNSIAGVPDRNKLSISPGHIDLEFDETFRAMHASTYIELLLSAKCHVKSPNSLKHKS